MRKYDSYKDSGVEWIGEIPRHWIKGKWGYYYNSGMGSTILKEDLVEDGEVPVYSATEEDRVFGYINNPKLILNEGDIVIPARGNSIGHVKLILSKSTTSQTTIYSKSKDENLDSRYSYYYCKGNKTNLFPFVQTAIPQITVTEISFNPIIIPPLSEQQQIVSFLDTKTSLIDSLIEKTQRKIELLKEKRLKLVEDVILNSNTKRVRLGYVVDLVKRPIDRENNETYTKIGMYNWGRGIFKYPSELGSDLGDSTFNYLKEGDLLLSGQFSWEGSVSLVEQEQDNCISSHRFHILNGIEGKILNEYLWSYFTSQEGHFLLNENSPGSAGRNRPLNIGKLLKEKIPIPDMNTQMEIKKLVIETRTFIQYSKRRTELLKEYRQSLISEVVTGKLKVTTNE